MSVPRIDELKPTPYIQKVLPLVYDDSLSYYENISQFINKLNEMTEVINGIETEILTQAKAYTDQKVADSFAQVEAKIAELRQLIAETTVEFDAKIAEVDRKYNQFENRVNAQLQIFNTRLDDLKEEIRVGIIGVNARTDLAIQQNNEYLFEEFGKSVAKLKVRNFFTGQMVSIQDMFDYLCLFHAEGGANVSEFATYEKTITEIVAINQNCTNWVLHGHNYLAS